MPSKSAKQHRFMEAIAHNKEFAKKVGVPQSVGKDFSAADKGKKFALGGVTRGGKGMINRQETRWGSVLGAAKGAPDVNLNKYEGKKEGGIMKGAKETMGPRTMSEDVEKGSNTKLKHGEHGVQKRGHTKGKNLGDSGPSVGIEGEKGMKRGGKAKVKKMASGGMAKGEHPIQLKGRTKGMQVAMPGADGMSSMGMKRGGKTMKHGGKC